MELISYQINPDTNTWLQEQLDGRWYHTDTDMILSEEVVKKYYPEALEIKELRDIEADNQQQRDVGFGMNGRP